MSTLEGWSHDNSYKVKQLEAKIEVLETRVELIMECLNKWEGTGFMARSNLEVAENKPKKLQKHNRRIILNPMENPK